MSCLSLPAQSPYEAAALGPHQARAAPQVNFRVIDGQSYCDFRPVCPPAQAVLGVTFQASKGGKVKVSTSYENGVSQRQCPGPGTEPTKLSLALSTHQVLALSPQSGASFPSPSPTSPA